ncbi:MAG: hypothetical protein ABWY82_00670 [Tardiphaga sp.]|jgi:hypothetical protein
MADKGSLAAFKLALGLVKAQGIASQNRDGVETLVHEAELFSIAFTPAKEERPKVLTFGSTVTAIPRCWT